MADRLQDMTDEQLEIEFQYYDSELDRCDASGDHYGHVRAGEMLRELEAERARREGMAG
jgi:hypothetical protein